MLRRFRCIQSFFKHFRNFVEYFHTNFELLPENVGKDLKQIISSGYEFATSLLYTKRFANNNTLNPVASVVQLVTSNVLTLGRGFKSRCRHTNLDFSSQK